MANMSYCRFQNTLDALRDCEDALLELDGIHLNDADLSNDERLAAKRLIDLCNQIAMSYGDAT